MCSKIIIIDARVVEKQYSHGIACYTYELICGLITKENTEKNFYYLLINKDSCLLRNSLPVHMKFIFMKTHWSSLLGQLELLLIIFKYKPNIFHSPSFIVPLLTRTKLIATIHDMNHVALAQNYSLKQKIYYFLLAKRLRKNSIVITVSQFSKDEIIKYMHLNSNLIYVIYNGISSLFKTKEKNFLQKTVTIRQKYNLPEKFIFTVGNSKPHKNMENLVEAYCQSNIAHPLVLLSNSYEKLYSIISKYNKFSSVIFLPVIEKQEELAQIYTLCSLFIFPSIYEGFGFPPLEAAACGVSVLCSNLTSLPEILQNSAYYFNPYSIEDMKSKLQQILVINAEERENKIQIGIQQAKKFRWEDNVEKTLKIYNDEIS